MTTTMTTRGGAWLIEEATEPIFTPERLSDEHRLIRQTAEEFVASEVLTVLDQLEQKDWALARALVRRSGDLGLLGTDVPEAYGGVELDKVSSIVVGEAVGQASSFATTFGAQTGLAITPLVCFGTEEQKQRYLPGLVSGEIVGAYALSESGSGSDALGKLFERNMESGFRTRTFRNVVLVRHIQENKIETWIFKKLPGLVR